MITRARPLPAGTDRFVGRARELRLLQEELRRSRLVTMTGPGGVGKTRLALELSRRRARKSGEVVLIDLSAIADESLVATAFATGLGLAGAGADPIADVIRVLASGQLCADGGGQLRASARGRRVGRGLAA